MPLRLRAAATGAAVACGVAGLSLAASHTTAAARPASAAHDSLERAIVRAVNQARAERGRSPLTLNRRLAVAADRHTRAMLRHDFLSHDSADGTSMTRRVRRHARVRTVGEVIAFRPDGTDAGADAVVEQWLGSAAHRTTLLGKRFHRVGLAQHRGTIGSTRGVVVTLDLAGRR